MRRIAVTLVTLLLLAGCGSSTAAPALGTIQFGTSQKNHVLRHPTSSFGPDDTFAYVARIKTSRPIPANSKIREFFVRVDSRGAEQAVMNDAFRLHQVIRTFVVLNSITVSDLYKVGFTAPGTYRVRLIHGGEKIAEGKFSLK